MYDELKTFNYCLPEDVIASEYALLKVRDSDDDGLSDLTENEMGYNPAKRTPIVMAYLTGERDFDQDGLVNYAEIPKYAQLIP